MRTLLSLAAILGLLSVTRCQQTGGNAASSNPGTGPNPGAEPIPPPPTQSLPVIPPINPPRQHPPVRHNQAQSRMGPPSSMSPPTRRGFGGMSQFGNRQPRNPWAMQHQMQQHMPWFSRNNVGVTLDRMDHPCGMSMRRRQMFFLLDHPDPFCECRTSHCDGGMIDASQRSQQDCGGPTSFARCCCAGTPYSNMWPSAGGFPGMGGGYPGMQGGVPGMPGGFTGGFPGMSGGMTRTQGGMQGLSAYPGQQQMPEPSGFPGQQPPGQGSPRFGTSANFGTFQDLLRNMWTPYR